MKKTEWFNRLFTPIEDNGLLPSIMERLIGTPARLEELVFPMNLLILTSKIGETWTIKEETGHLSDLEPLWYGRLEDIIQKETVLRATDLTNQLTHSAGHNSTELDILLHRFRERRAKFVRRLLQVTEKELDFFAVHPRLRTSMRIIDLAYFVAEHDDHHLARIREISVLL